MSTATSIPTTPPQPSERDQFWLDHHAAQEASGQTAKDYAAEHGVSLHALYQARKRLRRLGLLAPVPTTTARPKASKRRSRGAPRQTVSFSKVALAQTASEARFRIECAGVALEWDGGEVPETVAALLERLAQRP